MPNHSGFYSMKLESFTRFVKDDCLYKQRHTSIQDTMDLVEVLKNVFTRDGNKVLMDGNDYLAMPELFRVTSWTVVFFDFDHTVYAKNTPKKFLANISNMLYPVFLILYFVTANTP